MKLIEITEDRSAALGIAEHIEQELLAFLRGLKIEHVTKSGTIDTSSASQDAAVIVLALKDRATVDEGFAVSDLVNGYMRQHFLDSVLDITYEVWTSRKADDSPLTVNISIKLK